jgi:D-alanine-D-alanine ligase
MNLVVLMGGPSAEREVSLRSGAGVARALRSLGHRVEAIDVRGRALPGARLLRRADAVFLALHGTFGEDGTVQRLLDAVGVRYTGSGPEASARAMDKAESKRIFLKMGLETPAYGLVEVEDRRRAGACAVAAAKVVGFPVVVKPNEQGSSVGVSIHWSPESLERGAHEALAYGPRILVERYVKGREITVGILQGRALPAIELRPARAFFDYEAKYEDDRTVYVVNPEWLGRWRERVEAAALKAHRGLGCSGFSRVDMIVTDTGSIQVLEVNTLPGMTERSLFPKAAAAAGISYAELCGRLVKAALARADARTA